MSRFYPELKREIRESWKRLFDPSIILGNDMEYGTIWEIRREMGDRSNGIRLYISQAEAVMREIDSRGTCFQAGVCGLKWGRAGRSFSPLMTGL